MKRLLSLLLLCTVLSFCGCSALRDAWEPTRLFVSDRPLSEQTLAHPVAAMEADGQNDAGSRSVPLTEAPPEYDRIVMNFVGDVMLAAENGDDGFWSFNLFAYDTPAEY